jgi:hypothetical protein
MSILYLLLADGDSKLWSRELTQENCYWSLVEL